MAEVFRGVLVGERGTRRDVAIKRLRPDLRGDPAAVELFVGEAQIAVRLSHPNVVHALELTRDDAGYALVCEWLDCSALAEVHERCGDMPVDVVLHVGRSLCGALDYLHQLDGAEAPVVHRDVTPGNVFVTSGGQVKLGDFGVAWCPNPAAMVDVRAAGTPGFAAPEQSSDGPIDARADVYGVGATLASLSTTLPEPLRAIVDRACAEAPGERFSSAAELDAALAEVAAELELRIGSKALRTWLQEHGGLPEREAPPSLDGAVHSLLGGAIRTSASTDEQPALAPLTPAARGPMRYLTAGLLALALVIAGGAFWWRGEAGPNQPLADAVPHEAADPQPSEPLADAVPHEAADSRPSESLADAATTERADPDPAPTDLPAPVRAKRADRRRTLSPAAAARAAITAPPPARGRVVLNTVPWAEVHIGGRKVGNTPIRKLDLPAGEHVARLVHPPQGLEREVTLIVEANRTQTFVVNLHRGTVDRRVERKP